MSFFDYLSPRYYLNYLGGTVRWLIGSSWSRIVGSKKYSFREYLYGPNDSDDFIIDGWGHQIVNNVLGIATVLLIASLIHAIDYMLHK